MTVGRHRGWRTGPGLLACALAATLHAAVLANDDDDGSPPAKHLSAVEITLDERGLVVTLTGDGGLAAAAIRETPDWPPRLVIDLPDVASWVRGGTRVDEGPVQGIRVLPADRTTEATRLVFDLRSPADYEVVRPEGRSDRLQVIFPFASTAGRSDGPRSWELPTTARISGGAPRAPTRYADYITLLSLDAVRIGWPLPRESTEWPTTTARANAPAPRPPASRFIHPGSVTRVAAASAQSPLTGGGREYTGDPVTLDFQEAPLRSVLRTFAEISGLNIVIDPQVAGTVDVALRAVPWDQALDIILRANQLGYQVDGTIVRIAPLTVLADEEAQRRKLAEEQALSGELVVLTRTLSYARAETMAQLVTQSVLSARGQVQTDERTNTLIITDLRPRLSAVEELLDALDRAEPQVEIEARIVQASQDFTRSIGVQWGITGRVAPELGNTTPLTFPNRGGVSGRLGAQGPGAGDTPADARASEIEAAGTAVNLPAEAASAALGVTMGSVDGALNLDVVISAGERDGEVRLLSHPRVTTQNNVQAEIVQGDQIPIQTVANNTVTVQFEDAALSLRVTPQITAADTVIMQIEIDNDFADFGRAINGIPPIVTQRASTTVQVADGNTTVIGGIFESARTQSDDRVPGLHRIPLLGWLFKSQTEIKSTDELFIFLTPRIVR